MKKQKKILINDIKHVEVLFALLVVFVAGNSINKRRKKMKQNKKREE